MGRIESKKGESFGGMLVETGQILLERAKNIATMALDIIGTGESPLTEDLLESRPDEYTEASLSSNESPISILTPFAGRIFYTDEKQSFAASLPPYKEMDLQAAEKKVIYLENIFYTLPEWIRDSEENDELAKWFKEVEKTKIAILEDKTISPKAVSQDLYNLENTLWLMLAEKIDKKIEMTAKIGGLEHYQNPKRLMIDALKIESFEKKSLPPAADLFTRLSHEEKEVVARVVENLPRFETDAIDPQKLKLEDMVVALPIFDNIYQAARMIDGFGIDSSVTTTPKEEAFSLLVITGKIFATGRDLGWLIKTVEDYGIVDIAAIDKWAAEQSEGISPYFKDQLAAGDKGALDLLASITAKAHAKDLREEIKKRSASAVIVPLETEKRFNEYCKERESKKPLKGMDVIGAEPCEDLSKEEKEAIQGIFEKEIINELPERFSEADNYLSSDLLVERYLAPHSPWTMLPITWDEILNGLENEVKSLEDFLGFEESIGQKDLATTQQLMMRQWLTGRPTDNNDRGFATWFAEDMARQKAGVFKLFRSARQASEKLLSNISKLPDDPSHINAERLMESNQYLLDKANHILDLAKEDSEHDERFLTALSIGTGFFGMAAGKYAANKVLAWLIKHGAEESGKMAFWGTYLANTLGWTVGTTGAMAFAEGMPTIGKFSKEFASNLGVFGAAGLAGRAVRLAFKYGPVVDLLKFSEETALAAKGKGGLLEKINAWRNNNAIKATLGTPSFSYTATEFGGTVTALGLGNEILPYIYLSDEPPEETTLLERVYDPIGSVTLASMYLLGNKLNPGQKGVDRAMMERYLKGIDRKIEATGMALLQSWKANPPDLKTKIKEVAELSKTASEAIQGKLEVMEELGAKRRFDFEEVSLGSAPKWKKLRKSAEDIQRERGRRLEVEKIERVMRDLDRFITQDFVSVTKDGLIMCAPDASAGVLSNRMLFNNAVKAFNSRYEEQGIRIKSDSYDGRYRIQTRDPNGLWHTDSIHS